MYSLLGAKVAYRPAEITFPSGAVIKTGHLKDDQAYTKYQGHEYQRILIEELNQIPDEKRYLQLLASCRSTAMGISAQIFCTTNPGGVGHGWVKRRFVDIVPPNTVYLDPVSNRSRIYIPARIDDNPTLLTADPNYIHFLDSLKETDEELWKAWRLGDWDTFAGQFFKEFRRDLHVIPSYKPNKQNVIIGGMDWGRTAPFSWHLGEVEVVNMEGTKFHRVKTFLEIYGTNKTPNEWASEFKERIKFFGLKMEDISFIEGDPAMFKEADDGSIGIADMFKVAGIHKLRPADNDRVGGWTIMHNWLSLAPDGKPYWQIAENCTELIRTLPQLVHDDNRVEDVDTESEDHACFCRHTEILTKRGIVPIIDVKEGDYTWTPVGWSKIKKLHKIGKRPLFTFLRMKSTKQHPYLTQDGFRQLRALTVMDKLWSVFTFSESPTGDTLILQDIPMRSISAVVRRREQALLGHYMSMSGNTLKERLTRTLIFIIRVVIMIETISKILKWSLIPNMLNYIERVGLKPLESILKLPDHLLLRGTSLKRLKRYIVGLQNKHGSISKHMSESAIFVRANIGRFSLLNHGSAASTAKCPCLDVDEVYSLTTDSGMFTAGYVVVSNSDDQRYMFKRLKWINAKLGGISHSPTIPTTIRKTAEFVDGKQIGLDLSLLAQTNKPNAGKRVGAINKI